MRNLILICGILLMVNAYATIEADDNKIFDVSQEEIMKNRACFKDLETNGCGDPGEDPKQFRACMSNVYPKLDVDCQKLMNKLYKPR
jgi:hypothetical protein